MKQLYKDIKIKKTAGTKLIKDAKYVFYWIDSDFANYGLTTEEIETVPTNVEIFEMDKDATFRELFTDPEHQWMTQEQVITFVTNEKDKLQQDGYATFFLLKKDNQFFVAEVLVVSVGLGVGVFRFGHDDVWRAVDRHRVVVPRLDTQTLKSASLSNLETLTLESAIKIVKDNGFKVIKEY